MGSKLIFLLPDSFFSFRKGRSHLRKTSSNSVYTNTIRAAITESYFSIERTSSLRIYTEKLLCGPKRAGHWVIDKCRRSMALPATSLRTA